MLNPEQLRMFFEAGNRRLLAKEDIDELGHLWRAVTAPTPHALMDYRPSSSPRFPYLAEGLRYFMMRYPDKRTGLNHHQTSLLLQAEANGPSAARIIGFTMGMANALDITGDLYLFDVMKKLGYDLPHPALALTGDLRSLRATEARITDIGKQFLKGEANFSQLNGIDSWVGGVHLTLENIWYHDNGKIIGL